MQWKLCHFALFFFFSLVVHHHPINAGDRLWGWLEKIEKNNMASVGWLSRHVHEYGPHEQLSTSRSYFYLLTPDYYPFQTPPFFLTFISYLVSKIIFIIQLFFSKPSELLCLTHFDLFQPLRDVAFIYCFYSLINPSERFFLSHSISKRNKIGTKFDCHLPCL